MKKSCKITLVFLIAIAVFFISCENDLKEVALLTQKGKLVPTESSTQLNVLYTDSGAMQFRLKAPLMDHYLVGVKDPYSEFLKGVYIEHYGKDNTVKTTIKADYAIRYDVSHKMEAKYNVEIVNENGEKLKTEHVVWDEEKHKIYTDAYVEITTKREIIKGTGMEANEDFSEWEIKNVSGTLPLDEK